VLVFLSDEWIAALDALVARGRELATSIDVPIVVEHVVHDAPGGAVRYHLVVGGGEASVRTGPASRADVTLLWSYDAAVGIARGTANAQGAIASGGLRLRGDVGRIGSCAAALAAFGDLFGELRARTDYRGFGGTER
jgi:hypothetical protein